MPAKVTGLARSPIRAFPGFTGQTPSALTPTGILPTSSVSRTQPLMMTPCRTTWGLSVSGLHFVLRVSHMHDRHESSCASPLGVSQPSHSCAALPLDGHRAQRRAYDLKYGILCAHCRYISCAETHRPAFLVHLCRKQVTKQSTALGCLPINNQHATISRLLESLQCQLSIKTFLSQENF